MSETFRCNCLVWALHKYWREGGYVAFRRSHQWRFVPHFIWSPDLQKWFGFTPVKPKRGFVVALVCWWFLGSVTQEKFGD